MRTDRETTRLVRSWLEEGATALPDRVLDAVLDQVPATPQRSARWPARRYADMNNTLKVALSAAAVVVVAVVAINLLSRAQGPGGAGVSPSAAPPSATPVPSVAETPAATSIPSLAEGPLDRGTYTIDDTSQTAIPLTFTVPAGWFYRSDGYVYRNEDPDELGFNTDAVTHVYADACKSEGAITPVGPTVDDLVRALVDQANSNASTPVDVTLGGNPAKRIDISIPADLDLSTCRVPEELIQIWADPAETSYFALPAKPAGIVGPVYIADVNGDRVVIYTNPQPGSSASDLAELQAVLDSITFQP